jgi:predicted transposase YbfD/YdcC
LLSNPDGIISKPTHELPFPVLISSVVKIIKLNEITAIPELLKLLTIEGAIITIDAMGCQKKIIEQIKSQGGEYVIALKGNQGNLHAEIENTPQAHEGVRNELKLCA